MTEALTSADLLERLISFDTTSHRSNRPMADFIADYLARPGIRIRQHESPDGEKTNLVIEVGPDMTDRATGLTLSGHMDTVPALEREWVSDPFRMDRREGCFFGRGAADMKGFLALAVNAVAKLDPKALGAPLVLVLTYDEELGTLGAKHFAETWPERERLPTNAIVGEPTSLEVVRLHKGHLHLRIEIDGVSAHSGYPHLGRSAIEPLSGFIGELTLLRHELETERPPLSEFFPQVPFVALNLGTVAGGSAVNVVPDHARLDLLVRILPRMKSSDVIQRIESRLEGLVARGQWRLTVVNESPPFLLPEDSRINQWLCRRVEQTETVSVSYATDAGWFREMGLECAIFGPASIEVAHKPNEFMPEEEFWRGEELLDEAIRHFCLIS